MRQCKYQNKCWLAGAYNYCKTASCTEPLLPKDGIRVPEPGKDLRIDAVPNKPLPLFEPIRIKLPVETVIKQGELF